MNPRKLHLAFLWHMHQPYYRNDINGEIIMPWVRLHSMKNYFDIPKLLTNSGNLKMTFNLTPSLLRQIEGIIAGDIDSFEEMTGIPPEELDREQKRFVLKNFFMLHPNLIANFPRFQNLWEKRGKNWQAIRESLNPDTFSAQELRDIQVLYNLAWCGWELRSKSEIKELIRKGSDYTEEDKKILSKTALSLIKEVIHLYRRLQESGQIEISCSPFYHPILPLLIDIQTARISSPGITLPNETGKYLEDAAEQLKSGLKYIEETIGRRNSGIWPSEGSVSTETLELAAEQNISWAATDDEILRLSLDGSYDKKNKLLKPYVFQTNKGEITLFFRNHYISDRIGFTYSRINSDDAVEDFIKNLKKLYSESSCDDPIVSIILDGENTWEFFPDHGHNFLTKLVKKIEESEWIETITFSEYLSRYPQNREKLTKLHPGSWIYANFNTWIGHPEKNRAWDKLLKAREAVKDGIQEGTALNKIQQIMNEIYIAEGSDWFWWYGDDHTTEFAYEFDSAFRQHIINIYNLLGRTPPSDLYTPIFEAKPIVTFNQPVAFINPKLNGSITQFFEWSGSGEYNPYASMGAMHKTDFSIKRIMIGFNLENLFIRIETSRQRADHKLLKSICKIIFLIPHGYEIHYSGKEQPIILKNGEKMESAGIKGSCAEVSEIGIQWSTLGLIPGQTCQFYIELIENSVLSERHPMVGNFNLTVPDESFEGRNWLI